MTTTGVLYWLLKTQEQVILFPSGTFSVLVRQVAYALS